jgi:hypothetical protein
MPKFYVAYEDEYIQVGGKMDMVIMMTTLGFERNPT